MTISVARQTELLLAVLRYLKAHNMTNPGADPAGGVNTTQDRAAISLFQGHQRGYHGDKRMTVDGTFNTYSQAFLDDHFGADAGNDPAFVRPVRLFRGQVNVVPPTSEYAIVDAEGACCIGGRKVHAGLDWFGGPGADVLAPEAGTLVNVQASTGNSGQVFGGVVRVQVAAARLAMPAGHVWVFRHVEPLVAQGAGVEAGQRIARIISWADWVAGSHTHIELWKSWRYGTEGYRVDNMLDPRVFLAQAAIAEAFR